MREDDSIYVLQVQHAGLRDSFAADAFTVDVLVKAVHFLFPGFNYQWLVEEVKHTLPKVSCEMLSIQSPFLAVFNI